MNKNIIELIRFLQDTCIAYLFAVIYLIPIINVLFLRFNYKDSKSFLNKYEPLRKLKK